MLGLIALGKGSRPDFDDAMRSLLPKVRYSIVGALDSLDESVIASLAEGGDYLLRVPAYGSSWEIPRDRLLPYVRAADSALRQQGAAVTLLMCAGDFPFLSVGGILLYPGRIMPSLLKAFFPWERSGHIGIILPNETQMRFAAAHWERWGLRVTVDWASPSAVGAVGEAVRRLSPHVDAIVLDCMGFGLRHEQEAGGETDKPVFSSLRGALCIAGSFVSGKNEC